MESIMKAYPIRACEYEKINNVVVVFVKKQNPNILDKKVFKKYFRKPHKIDLDEIGSFVWELCDGDLSVEEIAVKVRETFSDKVEPAEKRVELFIRQMTKTKLINLFTKETVD